MGVFERLLAALTGDTKTEAPSADLQDEVITQAEEAPCPEGQVLVEAEDKITLQVVRGLGQQMSDEQIEFATHECVAEDSPRARETPVVAQNDGPSGPAR